MDDRTVDDRYGVPDADSPELTDEDMAAARRWQQGDPVSSHAAKLEAALRQIVRASEDGDAVSCGEIARQALR